MRAWIGVGTLLCLLATGAPARADKAQAAKAFKKGKRLFGERDYVGALQAFEQTFALHKHHVVLCNIARCHERLSDMIKAKRYFERCLAAGASKKPALAARVRAALKLVASRISYAMVRSPGEGGVVYVDGEARGRTPRRVALNPGRRIIEVRRAGAEPARTSFSTSGGEMRTLDLVPKPITRTTPAKRRGLSQVWFWSAVAATAGLTAAAVVFSLRAKAAERDFIDLPSDGRYDHARSQQLWANVFIGAAALAAGGATTLFFFTDFGGERPAPRKQALSIGLGLRGSF